MAYTLRHRGRPIARTSNETGVGKNGEKCRFPPFALQYLRNGGRYDLGYCRPILGEPYYVTFALWHEPSVCRLSVM